jgi:hypothetical protein
VDGSNIETVYDAADLNFRDGLVHLESDPVHRMIYWKQLSWIARGALDGSAPLEIIHPGVAVGVTLDIPIPEPTAGWIFLPAVILARRRR